MNSSDLAELFQRALETPLAERERFLTTECGEDTALRREVEDLLGAFERAESSARWRSAAIEHEAAAIASGAPSIEAREQRIGRYELLERLGAGGMGVVYKALRTDDRFSQVVALKIVMTRNAQVVERFHQERQILARLEHPHIARLLDVGATGDGAPFLAMEYVEGEPLDKYLKTRRLSQREILGLFLKVCAAVAYAHRNLIVHRDLKPGNILVTAAGEPKLLDFGIAKLLDAEGATTRTGAMTPEYASPEQVSGGAITTASDVYALGVVLYEALSGQRPYGDVSNPLELAKAILTGAPGPMAGVDRDLETIVQMALRKEPERRYSSVEQLAADIERYLTGYPVMARPDARGYRAAKFVRRNRLGLAVAAGALLAVLGGAAAIAREGRIAERRFEQVRKLAGSLTTEIDETVRDLPGAGPARRTIVKRALEYLDGLAQERHNDRELTDEIAEAYSRVADAQESLGDYTPSLASAQKALALYDALWKSNPKDVRAGVGVMRCSGRVFRADLRQTDLQGAVATGRRAVALGERLAAQAPNDPTVLHEAAVAYMYLADVVGNTAVASRGNAKEGLALIEKARQAGERMVRLPISPRDREAFQVTYGSVFGRLGEMKRMQSDLPGAAEALRRAIEIDEGLVREAPLKVTPRQEVAVYSRTLSLVMDAMRKFADAETAGQRGYDLFAELAKENPASALAQEQWADSMYSQAKFLMDEGKLDEARRMCEEAVAKYRKLIGEHPGRLPLGLRTSYQIGAAIALKMDDPRKAIEYCNGELEIADRLLAADARVVNAQNYRGLAFGDIGVAHEKLAARGRGAARSAEWREARQWHQKSLEVWTALEQDGRLSPAYAPQLKREQDAVKRGDRALS